MADELPATGSTDTEWPGYGSESNEQRFSSLNKISASTVNRLGLAWHMDLPGAKTLEATPLLIDGILYFSDNDSVVYAVDARSGELLWQYDPEVWKVAGKRYRQNFHVNRGVAHWQGKIYVGTFDGRLIAIDAKKGVEIWSVQTLEEGAVGTITGAPRTFNSKVIIGQGGSEAGRNRGYVTAYDASNGEKAWRFHVVPGNPEEGFENEAMAMAAQTWTGEWWKYGGGGSPWNAMTFDAELNRVYIGTGNGFPWNQKIRSPGGGDNLFLCSIVALDADSGEYIWHYQTNPGETWDYSSTQDIILADLAIDGLARKVILHAPKNGFFYVIDRRNGKLISAEKLGRVTWAERIDIETGRPVETPIARLPNNEGVIQPGGAGLHNWQAMSYSPKSGYAYIPKMEMPQYFSDKTIDPRSWQMRKYFINTGYDDIVVEGVSSSDVKLTGTLLAWDPVRQRKVWEVNLPGIWNGGTLVTAGDLVFQGNASGEFAAYHSMSGKNLWSAQVGLGVVAAPITYQLDEEQYVAVLVGWGGVLPGTFGMVVSKHGWQYGQQEKRLVVYKLDGKVKLPLAPKSPIPVPLDNPDIAIDDQLATQGMRLYHSTCSSCHGFSVVAGGIAPDLRASNMALHRQSFRAVVKDGALERRGMPVYEDLSDAEVEALYLFIRQRARRDLEAVPAE